MRQIKNKFKFKCCYYNYNLHHLILINNKGSNYYYAQGPNVCALNKFSICEEFLDLKSHKCIQKSQVQTECALKYLFQATCLSATCP